MTVEYYGFEWDSEKNEKNKEKHKISFETAVHIFDDPFLIEDYDAAHSSAEEDRYQYIGMTGEILLLFVIATDRGEKMRIISARKADRDEERMYNEQNAQNL